MENLDLIYTLVIARSNIVATWQSSVAKCFFFKKFRNSVDYRAMRIYTQYTPIGYMRYTMENDEKQQCTACCSCCTHQKHTPRSDEELKSLNSRLNRIIGQLGGIKNMLNDNRYCGDILIQLSAVQRALESFGYEILGEHLKTCVVENVQDGNVQILDEAIELIKKMK